MNLKKNVNTNLGITIILVFAAIFTIVSFYIVGAYMDGYPFNELSGNIVDNSDNVIEDSDLDSNEALLSEQEALAIGNYLYEKAAKSYYGIYETEGFSESSGPQYVYYTMNDDSSFSIDENGGYRKLLVDDMKAVFTYEMFEKLYYIKNAYYIVGIDNNYYMESLGVGGNPTYVESKLSIDSIENDTIVFNVNSYYDYSDYVNELDSKDDVIKVETSKFTLEKEDGKWKVSEFTLPF